MTINKKHTIAECRDLMATIDFRIKAVAKLIADTNTKPGAFLNPGQPFVTPQTIDEWNTWVNRWRAAQDSVSPLLTGLVISNPLVSPSVQMVEGEWRKLINAITTNSCGSDGNDGVFCDVGAFKAGDMTFQINKIQKEAQGQIDETNRPQPTADDPDFKAFLTLDKAIRDSEDAAKKAGAATKSAAFQVPWYVWVGGVVVVGGVATAYAAPVLNLLPRRR